MSSESVRIERVTGGQVGSGFTAVLYSEWTRFVSLRSNLWTLIAAAFLSIVVGAVFTLAHLEFWSGLSAEQRALIDPVHESFVGLSVFGILGFAVVGALAMTSEFSSGTIATTLTAVPRRLQVFAAKILVIDLTVLGIGMLTAFAAFFLAQPILAREALDVSIADTRVLQAVAGAGIYTAAAASIGLALGSLIRRTAATVVAVAAVFSLATIVSLALPESLSTYTKFLPHSAGLAMMSSIDHASLLSPLAGTLVLAAWTALALVAAGILFVRRDASA
jgi:ABC-2 type transport system permease protein